MHQVGRELDDIAEGGVLRGERGADIGEGETALRVEIACGLAVLASTDLPGDEQKFRRFNPRQLRILPSGLPRLSGLRI